MSLNKEGVYLILTSILATSFVVLTAEHTNQRKAIELLEKNKPIYFEKNVMGDPTKNEAFYVIGKDTAYMKIDGVDISDRLK